MQGVLDIPSHLVPIAEDVASALLRVARVFDEHLRTDLPPVASLVRHVENYRGKMLRPSLVTLAGLASGRRSLSKEHDVLGAVIEMVHMATLVHDDVLDEADVRRRGATVNRLHGNEAAVILGDYLIASAYHLCSTLPTPDAARMVGQASVLTCQGELLQLHHRNDLSLDEATYFEIVARKTADLIACACSLGAHASAASQSEQESLASFGAEVGVAFQIQDDLLDLTGSELVVGKTLHRDSTKGKLTLPVIHHLASVPPLARGESLELLEAAAQGDTGVDDLLRERLHASGSIEHARSEAQRRVTRAKHTLTSGLSPSPARDLLLLMADAVTNRTH